MSPAKDNSQLILDHMHLVDRIARQVMHTFKHHLDFDDLVQSGYVGLVEAARRFEPGKGKFASFAYFRIRGAMIDSNRRAAYREATHDSVEGMQERLGFVPARVSTCRRPLPDEIAAKSERARVAARAIARLPDDQRFVLIKTLRGEELPVTAKAKGRSLTWARVKLRAARETVAIAVQGEKAA